MSEKATKHTPGPWLFGCLDSSKLGNCFAVWPEIDDNQNGDTVCVIIPGINTNVTDEANAKLIAAAPELLRELIFLMSREHVVDALPYEDEKRIFDLIQKATHKPA